MMSMFYQGAYLFMCCTNSVFMSILLQNIFIRQGWESFFWSLRKATCHFLFCKFAWAELHWAILWQIKVIAELAECSPIIIQNSSNPSSRKNLDVWLYDRTTVQLYNCTTVQLYKVLLSTYVVNCTVGTPTPRLCSVVQWSVHWLWVRQPGF